VTFWEAGAAMFFVKAINNVFSLSRGMPKLNSIGLVGDYLYSRMAEKTFFPETNCRLWVGMRFTED
jgi:hypothetical protein